MPKRSESFRSAEAPCPRSAAQKVEAFPAVGRESAARSGSLTQPPPASRICESIGIIIIELHSAISNSNSVSDGTAAHDRHGFSVVDQLC